VADAKISDLTTITGATVATSDVLPVVDVSDTTMALSGTTKKITIAELITALTTLGIQPLDADLTAIAALASAANKVPYATGSGAWALADLTAAGRALIDDADAAAQRTTLSVPKVSTTTPAEGDLLSWDSANSTYSPRKATPGLNLANGLAPVFARALIPFSNSFGSGANYQTQTRLRHYSLTDVFDFRLVYTNFAGTGTFTLEAAVENVFGTIRRVTFNGAPTATLAVGGVVVSDPIAWAIAGPANANPAWSSQAWPYFFTRQLCTLDAAGGQTPRIEGINTGIGDCCETGTGLTNKVMSGSIGTAGADPYGPSAIVGVTAARQPVVMAFGDSIVAGSGDLPTAGTPGGYVMRALYNLKIPNQRHGVPSEQTTYLANVDNFTPQNSLPFELVFLAGCSHAICEYGINDLNPGLGNQPASVLKTRWVAAWKMLASRGVKVYQTTLLPYSTSTDGWVTVVNQTPFARESHRVDANDWVRDGAPLTSTASLTPVATGTVGALRAGDVGHPLYGYIEAADVAESARNSGKWKANYTSDGVHPNATGSLATSACITLAQFAI
jgi:lysophospholipase L1-like esterase